MAKMWRLITAIVLIVILIGVVAGAVGFMTGADSARIYQKALSNDTIAQTRNYTNWAIDVVKAYGETLIKLAEGWLGN